MRIAPLAFARRRARRRTDAFMAAAYVRFLYDQRTQTPSLARSYARRIARIMFLGRS